MCEKPKHRTYIIEPSSTIINEEILDRIDELEKITDGDINGMDPVLYYQISRDN